VLLEDDGRGEGGLEAVGRVVTDDAAEATKRGPGHLSVVWESIQIGLDGCRRPVAIDDPELPSRKR
jgi:hypothetical protein